MKTDVARAAPKPSSNGRSVTLLGATGSIGASTVDLLKRERERYRVEAVSANKNASALAALARELGARFAAIGDPAAYRELKEALGGTGIAAGAGESALVAALIVAKIGSAPGALAGWLAIGALAVILSVVAQGGDLFESFLKRRFGAKDSGHLIPGHGGLMDRLDGFVTASALAALIGLLRGGFDAPGRGLLVW